MEMEEIYAENVFTTDENDPVAGIAACRVTAIRLLGRIARRVDDLDRPIAPTEYRQLTGALKDIRDVLCADADDRNDRTVTVILGEADALAG